MLTAVALSGGVDSLFTLALLRDQGRDVLGIHALFLPPDKETLDKVQRLQTLCSSWGISLHTLDLSREFRAQIIEPFISSYKQGLTPNPCSLCNARIKFGLLLENCIARGAERMATGHYARLQGGRLYRGLDRHKEQSYFLAQVAGHSLEHVDFPLGEYRKEDVVLRAAQRGLAPIHDRESQEVCFISGDYREFLRDNCPDLPGEGQIVDAQGRHLGWHKGLWSYTLGQRRGLGIAHEHPLYVLDKDWENNRLIVGPKKALWSSGCEIHGINTIVPVEKWPERLWVQTRYRQEAKPAVIRENKERGTMEITFIQSQKKPTPGQIAAMYTDKGEVLGAGTIFRESHACEQRISACSGSTENPPVT